MSTAKPVAWISADLLDGEAIGLVRESDYLSERKAREAAEAQIAELNSINSKLCEMMDEELENAKEWEAKAEAAEADARRYRWLKMFSPLETQVRLMTELPQIPWGQWDAAIDAAMQEAKK